jgi:hypothetical protein
MRKINLTLAVRRELNAVKGAARVRYARIAATIDRTRPVAVQTTAGVRPKRSAAPKVKTHRTSVTAVGDKFLAVCTCREVIQKNATGEPYAKGIATKHTNATSVVTA